MTTEEFEQNERNVCGEHTWPQDNRLEEVTDYTEYWKDFW